MQYCWGVNEEHYSQLSGNLNQWIGKHRDERINVAGPPNRYHPKSQKKNIFMKLVDHASDRALFLKQSSIAKQPSGMKTGYHSGKFLYQCLVNRFFCVSKYVGITVLHSLGR